MSPSSQTQVAIIGAGPAGLMAAEVLARGGAAVAVYDAMPSAGRKFLMAGRGGLNLTHSEALPEFLTRYGVAAPRLATAIKAFPPAALRAWSEALGQPTFIGSSGRVFPTAFKASPLLRAWLRRLDRMGVQLALRHRWTGWNDEGQLLFRTPDGKRFVDARATIVALGGASWPRLGSNGAWVETLAARGFCFGFGFLGHVSTMPVFCAPPRVRLKHFDRDRIGRGSWLGLARPASGAFRGVPLPVIPVSPSLCGLRFPDSWP